ncbi:hypothetical protein PCC7418_3759 [Halothece sp. PCC 7418]|uniref:hypothetical protein n=1 Tax=Halothece sp. (strain PCC 7418) TaxID=65093 RepID=UPI0002A05BEA|nr:hypothetical protein [Halothece sp. PCC 7418]AFZ45863.1 hypothetical protein PCC7418_3759 [Halothece sp. PCC 7418]
MIHFQVLTSNDSELEMQVQRLHHLMVWSRWLLVLGSWVITLPIIFWQLQEEIALMQSHFTLAAVRYAFIFNPYCAIALSWCLGITTAVLLWQSSNILFGFSPRYRQELEKQVRRIRRRGKSHFLWRWVIND